MQRVIDKLHEMEQDVAFYQQRVIRLEGAVLEINRHFTDERLLRAWYGHIEICRDNLSGLLDKADGKKK